METRLAKNESLVKSWNYAQAKSRRGLFNRNKISNELTITNKRIISRNTDKYGSVTQEIFMNDVKGISGLYATKRNIFLTVLFILLALVCISLMMSVSPYIGIGAVVFGLIALLIYIFSKKACLVLCITTRGKGGDGLDIAAGASSFFGRSRRRNKKKIKVKVKVDYESAKEIVNTIGAIVLEGQAGNI